MPNLCVKSNDCVTIQPENTKGRHEKIGKCLKIKHP
jgi:hypothetical protein